LKSKLIGNLFDKHNFRPNKKLGQIFLVDENILKKLIDYLNIKSSDYILEIGAGFGSLTKHLIRKAKRVFAVEKDKRLCNMIYEYLGECPDNLEIIHGDILKFNIKKIYKIYSEKIRVIGNLPYYITSPIISYLIENKDYMDSIQLTVQKEVADRILAKPSTKDYSFLTLLVQFHLEALKLFNISKSCFFPPPEVDSTVLRFEIPRVPKFKVYDKNLFFKIVDAGFSQRRKTFLNALTNKYILKKSKEELLNLLKSLGINPSERAEELAIEEFVRITNSILP